MKKIFSIILLSIPFLFSGILHADDFEDMEKLLKEVKSNYGKAVGSDPGSRVAMDFENKMFSLVEKAKIVQAVIERLDLGQDFNFLNYSNMLRRAYRTDSAKKGTSPSKGDTLTKGVDYNFPVTMMENDIKELQKINFSTANGGSYDRKFVPLRGIIEFERLFDFYMTYYNKAVTSDPTSVWREQFERRLKRMQVLSTTMNASLMKSHPEILKECDFYSETSALSRNYFVLAFSHSAKEKDSDRKSNSRIRDDRASSDNAKEDIKLSIKKIKDALSKLHAAGFDTPAKSEPKTVPEKTIDSSLDEDDEYPTDLGSLLDDSLHEKLQGIRESIYQHNTKINGIDPLVMKHYTQLLGTGARKEFNELTKKYKTSGYTDEEAKAYALLELRGLLKSKQFKESRKDMIDAIKRYESKKASIDADFGNVNNTLKWK